MNFKKILLVSVIILVALVGMTAASAIDSESVEDNVNLTISDDTDGSLNSAPNIEFDNQSTEENKLSLYDDDSLLGEVIVLDAEDGHNEMDESTIQVAINNAKANDTIIINGKSYEHCHFVIDKQLTIKSNVGTSLSPCPSNSQGSGYRGIFYISPEASGTVIEGFSLTDRLLGENDYGILVRGASDVIIRDCTIKNNAKSDGIRIENAQNTIIENVTVTSNANGIRIKNSQNVIVNNSEIKGSRIGINVSDSIQTTITNNIIDSNKVSGIYVCDGTSYTNISSNNITNNKGKGIDIETADHVYVLSNYIAFNKNNNAGVGVYVNCNVVRLEIIGNFLRENGNYGILYDYRVKNIGPNGVGEKLSTVNNNYFIGHTDRAIYHVEYRSFDGGDFIYDAENDVYVQVEDGEGDYIAGMTTAYLGYSYLISEQLCPSIYFTWNALWTAGDYKLRLSDITQIRKGTYSISVVNPNDDIATGLSSVYVTFYLNKNNTSPTPQEGDVYKTVLIQDGTATVSFNGDDFNESGNVLTASFPGSKTRLKQNPYKEFNIDDSDIPGTVVDTILNVSGLTTYPNSGEHVIASLKDSFGNPIANEEINFVVDSKIETIPTDEEGNAEFNVSLPNEGNYTLYVTYDGDDVNYYGSEAQCVIIVKKTATFIECEDYYVVPTVADHYDIVLKDEDGNPLANQNVTFNLDGKNYVRTTNSSGQASLEITFNNNGTDYEIMVTYEGDAKFKSTSKSSFIHVRYSSKSPELIVPAMDAVSNTIIFYTVTLNDFNGHPFSGQFLEIDIDGVRYYNYTNDEGQISIKLQFSDLKRYEVTALYNGSDVYNRTSASNYITVDKLSTRFVAQNSTTLPNIEMTVPVILTTGSGEALPNQAVSVGIDGEIFTKETDSNGLIIINHTFNDEDVYPMTLNFNGTDQYGPANATVYVTVKKFDTSIESFDRTFSLNSNDKFTITLKDQDGCAIANQSIVFSFDGQNLTELTDANGQAGINTASKAGLFDVIVTYLGNAEYATISSANQITVLNTEGIVYVDENLPNSEIQRILNGCEDGATVEFLGQSYDNISLAVTKPLNILSKSRILLNAKQSSPVFEVLASDVNISGFNMLADSYDAICVSANNVRITGNDISNKLDDSQIDDYYNSTISLPGYGIDISNSCNVVISNNNISLFESGIFAEKSNALVISNNILEENNYGIKYGFDVSNSEIDSNLINNSIGLYTMEVPEGPRGYGIFFNNSAVNVTVIDNTITWGHIGISIDSNGSTGISITRNLITDNVLEGIRFNAGYDLAENPVDPVITDNAIYRNARGPSMMILGEMSANPGGIYGPGEWDDDAKLHIDANWYGVNSLTTWDYETGIVGIGTMCPRIKTTEIKFNEIVRQNSGDYSVTFYKNGEIASNLAEFDLFAILNKGTPNEMEVNFNVVNGVGFFSFDTDKFYPNSTNVIEIAVGSLNDEDRTYKSFYNCNVSGNGKFDAMLAVPDVIARCNTTGSVLATFSDIYGKAISGVNVKITVGDLAKTLKTDSNGKVSLDISSLSPGEYNVAVKTATTDNYNRATATAKAIVSEDKFNTVLTVPDVVMIYNTTGSVVATFNDVYGNVISGVNVKVTVGDLAKTLRTDANGQVALDIGSLAPGNYTVAVKTATTDLYNRATATANAEVNKIDTIVTVPDVLTVYNTTGKIVATFEDINGNAIGGVNVKITVGSIAKTLKTDAYGQVALDISSLEPGNYTVAVKTATTDIYYRATASANAIVLADKINTVLTVPDVVADYNVTNYVAATLKDVYGNALSDVNVKITVGNLAKTLRTDANGQVALDISSLVPGNYSASIKSATTDLYKRATATASVVVNKIDTILDVPDVIALYNTTGSIVATFKDINGNAIGGVNVKITVGDLAKTLKSDSNGQVSLDVSGFDLGTYAVSVKTATTDIYNRATQSATFQVLSKLPTTLTVPDVAVIQNAGGSVVATLNDAYGNAIGGVNVKITVGTMAKTLKTDANGKVSLDISGLNPGNYTVSVKSATTDIYERATATATAIVAADKIGTVLEADDVVTAQGSGDKIVATLKDVVGNPVSGVNVKISVGDIAKTLKTDADGQVALDVGTLAQGSYTANIKAAITDIYDRAASITAKVTITS